MLAGKTNPHQGFLLQMHLWKARKLLDMWPSPLCLVAELLSGEGRTVNSSALATIKTGVAGEIKVVAACGAPNSQLPSLAWRFGSLNTAGLIHAWNEDKKLAALISFPQSLLSCVLSKHLKVTGTFRFLLGLGRIYLGHQNWTRLIKSSLLTSFWVRANSPHLWCSTPPHANLWPMSVAMLGDACPLWRMFWRLSALSCPEIQPGAKRLDGSCFYLPLKGSRCHQSPLSLLTWKSFKHTEGKPWVRQVWNFLWIT